MAVLVTRVVEHGRGDPAHFTAPECPPTWANWLPLAGFFEIAKAGLPTYAAECPNTVLVLLKLKAFKETEAFALQVQSNLGARHGVPTEPREMQRSLAKRRGCRTSRRRIGRRPP
jgi:hypothetical protein